MIRIVSVALPKSPTNLAQGDEVRQIITRITRQRPSEILHILQNDFCNTILSKADVVRLVGHVQRMSQADNAAPNSIVVMDFTGSFATLAPRNDSMPLTHRQSTTGDLPVVPMCRS
jgi:hypothetical protein